MNFNGKPKVSDVQEELSEYEESSTSDKYKAEPFMTNPSGDGRCVGEDDETCSGPTVERNINVSSAQEQMEYSEDRNTSNPNKAIPFTDPPEEDDDNGSCNPEQPDPTHENRTPRQNEPPGHEEPSQQYSERTHYYQKTFAANQVHQRIRPTVIDRNKATNDPPPSRSNEVPTAPWYADHNTFILVLFSMVCIFIVVVVTVYLYFSKTGYITITNNPGANIRAAGNDVNG
ncbi:unnamed protein product [Clavelina lepadiformis]|uniref:Uncharacterized protein n=1 Tax=Clavelina lepadiformis TaxID=159417 RepID=A0ABP0F1E0_CLALP